MSHLDNYTLTCPHCGHTNRGVAFDPSCADECFCPNCDGDFTVDDGMDDCDEDDDE